MVSLWQSANSIQTEKENHNHKAITLISDHAVNNGNVANQFPMQRYTTTKKLITPSESRVAGVGCARWGGGGGTGVWGVGGGWQLMETQAIKQ